MKKAVKIILSFVAGILALVVLFLLVMNIAKFAIYNEYYSIENSLCKNPGLRDGFVCQGICISEKDNRILVSGYMADHSASRIYITDLENNSYYISLNFDSMDFTGHAGGIATDGNSVYIASDEAIYSLPLENILNSQNGDTLQITKSAELDNAASSLYINDGYLYVGEFHNGEEYVTNHPYDTADGTYNAIISQYALNDLTEPVKVYSIKNKVQGICFTPQGKIVLSTSYGLTDSVYYVYDEASLSPSDNFFEGAPVYYLDSPIREFKGPAMAEGLDYYEGKIITLTESASDKYIFGKLFFANHIAELEI